MRAGEIGYRAGPLLAAADSIRIVVKGRQAHGSRPWQSIDPVVTSAQIVNALQTIVSRSVDLTENPAIVTIGAVRSGIRSNIIPDSAELLGTVRTFDAAQREQVMARIKSIVEHTAAANGASATFAIESPSYPVTYNNPDLTQKMLPTLQRVAGEQNVKPIPLITGAEDFSLYAQKVPGLFFIVGTTPADQDPVTAPSNHSDFFFVDERAVVLGLEALTQVAIDYLQGTPE
jgi:amidohydrolase